MFLAVPGQIKNIFEADGIRMGRVHFGGIEKDVCLAQMPDIAVGDYTTVHVGFGITKAGEAAAHRTLAIFREPGLPDEELGAT